MQYFSDSLIYNLPFPEYTIPAQFYRKTKLCYFADMDTRCCQFWKGRQFKVDEECRCQEYMSVSAFEHKLHRK